MKKLIALFLISALLTGCANLKGTESPAESSSPAPAESISDTEESSEPMTEQADLPYATLPVATEPVVPENGDWPTIDDVTEPLEPSGPVEFDNNREDYTLEEVKNIINGFDRFSASENIFTDVPRHIDHIKERTEGMVDDMLETSMYDQYVYFLKTFKYIFGDDTPFYPEYLYVRGGFTDSDELFEPFYTYYDDFISGKKVNKAFNVRFAYTDNADTDKDDEVFLMTIHPIGACDTRFDRGVLAKIIYDNKLMHETYDEGYTAAKTIFTGTDKTSYGKYIGTYLPDSEKSYKLLDKETKIKDAVKVFEDYMNSLPTMHQPMYNIRVVKVSVYKFDVDDGLYVYYFDCAREYDNILFDSFGYAQQMIGGDDFLSDYNLGYMVRSDEVDFADGNYIRFMKTYEEQQYDDVISFEEAMQILDERLTKHVEFEVEEARLVYAYTEEFVDDLPRYHCKVYWRIVTHNINDDGYYFYYQNARDKDNLRYFSSNSYGGQVTMLQ